MLNNTNNNKIKIIMNILQNNTSDSAVIADKAIREGKLTAQEVDNIFRKKIINNQSNKGVYNDRKQ